MTTHAAPRGMTALDALPDFAAYAGMDRTNLLAALDICNEHKGNWLAEEHTAVIKQALSVRHLEKELAYEREFLSKIILKALANHVQDRRPADAQPTPPAVAATRYTVVNKFASTAIIPAPDEAQPEAARATGAKPIKLRRKFDSKLRKAIRGWAEIDRHFESTMDGLGMETTDDEWDVISAVFNALHDEYQKGEFPIERAYEIADEVRAKLAQGGAE